MSVEEWVEQSREETRQLFGDVGIHYDCAHFGTLKGYPFCNACKYWLDGYNSRNEQVLQCEKEVCYFYEPKRKDETNDS